MDVGEKGPFRVDHSTVVKLRESGSAGVGIRAGIKSAAWEGKLADEFEEGGRWDCNEGAGHFKKNNRGVFSNGRKWTKPPRCVFGIKESTLRQNMGARTMASMKRREGAREVEKGMKAD